MAVSRIIGHPPRERRDKIARLVSSARREMLPEKIDAECQSAVCFGFRIGFAAMARESVVRFRVFVNGDERIG
jgi:hypothetical protein